ncbi:3-oxoacyl-ACP reductase [Conexibacter sp. DBS9H8]|uniref:3-oxoacyl-ACP reductase n=1 Tax=Conexibacter sp. DBS9H8 TaxID=2937801 RepID=UPI00200DBC7E|nr:3-oxoacyl-ACP reductase [Conexibacter sp. DBS9H8]
MADRYTELINTPIGKTIAKQIGLPAPVVLERFDPNRPVIDGPVLFGGAPGATLGGPVAATLAHIGAETYTPLQEELRSAAAAAGLDAKIFNAETAGAEQTFKALVFDASGITDSTQLVELHRFFSPTIRRIRSCGRVIVLGLTPELVSHPRQRVAQRALEGFVRSVAKEVKKGASANLVYLTPGVDARLESTLRFLLSPRSAYVSGQVIRIGSSANAEEPDWSAPLAGKVALVTGAARGIGKAMAEVLARDGAHVVVLDVPQAAEALATVAADLGGSDLAVDITSEDAPKLIADHLLEHHGGVDVFVHNAGITRDKTLARMDEERWQLVLAINTSAIEAINAELVERQAFRANGRIVCVSSIAGIAGNFGQTNYGTSKAAVIGIVNAYAEEAAGLGITINAVAPGFIETQMTAAIPITIREAGRRMNSMSQGGLPVDVAETVAWLASPGSDGVNNNIVRVCGQSLLGA